jgi:long-chain fatty acid transport protein
MNRMKGLFALAAAVGALIGLQGPQPAYGSGFGIFTQGASALGQADAVVAHSDGPSAIFFNPALMNQLPGTQVEIGTTLLFPSRDFTSSTTGVSASTEDKVYFPSSFYVSHAFNDKISAGLGVFNPFGLGTEWNSLWEGRYIATKSTIDTYNINPVASYRITPDLSIAAGLDVIILDTTLENKVNLSGFGLPDANQKFKGNGTGVGYNLGIAYNAGHGISLGASYRSEVKVDITGDVTFELPTPALYGVLPNTNGRTSVTLPRQLTAGIAYQANDRLTMETGFRWEDWHSYRQLVLTFDQLIAGNSAAGYPKNWHDTFAVNIGGKYRLSDTFTLLAGYLYGWNPVPNETFDPAVPDANTHLFCAGAEARFDKFTMALSYGYQLQEDRNKQNLVGLFVGGTANGSYHADIHLVGLSLGYKF